MLLVVVVMVVFDVPGSEREGEIVITLRGLQTEADCLSLVLALMVERQQGRHCVLLHLPHLPHHPLSRHLEHVETFLQLES